MLALLLVACSVACANKSAPSPLAPLGPLVSKSPKAEADFREAQTLAERGDYATATTRFRAFLQAWPNDSLADLARLNLGRIELVQGRPNEALSWFRSLENANNTVLQDRVRLYAAVARTRLGDHTRAIAELLPFVGRTVDPSETNLLLEALSSAQMASGEHLAALETSDRALRGQLSNDGRKRMEARVKQLIADLAPSLALARAYEILPHNGYAWPEVARQLLHTSHAQGDLQQVAAIAKAMRAQGIELDDESAALVLRAERPTAEDPSVIGAILPLTGRGREAGTAALQGLLLAAGGPSVTPGTLRVVYRDDAGEPAKAQEAFDDLVSAHRVVAVVGPLDTACARVVAKRAADTGVPTLLLNADASLTERTGPVFRMLGDPREEANLLLERAERLSARRLLILHPQNPFGELQRRVFEAAARAHHAEVIAAIPYAPYATNLVREAEAASRHNADALILADAAARIKLLAPALAAHGLWSAPRGTRPAEGRAVLYLIPSVGFDPSLADGTHRYLQGALFAVPFDPAQAPTFTEAYRSQYESEPNLFSALAYDAFQFLHTTLQQGAETRKAVAETLRETRVREPASANRAFAENHGPAQPAHIETLLGEGFVVLD